MFPCPVSRSLSSMFVLHSCKFPVCIHAMLKNAKPHPNDEKYAVKSMIRNTTNVNEFEMKGQTFSIFTQDLSSFRTAQFLALRLYERWKTYNITKNILTSKQTKKYAQAYIFTRHVQQYLVYNSAWKQYHTICLENNINMCVLGLRRNCY